jgi:light-independent protochlorophyllide reductase subunit B
MQLTLWTYEGPAHVGAIRVAASMAGVHCLLHAPQGDSYADLLFTMIERGRIRPPVTYTGFQARDLGGNTAGMVKDAAREVCERFSPDLLLVGESCTAELIQDQPGALARGMGLPVPVLPLELPSFSRGETWGAAETFYTMVRALLRRSVPAPGSPRPERDPDRRPRANLLGATALGFRCRDDLQALTRLLDSAGVDVQMTAPLGARPADLLRLPEADFNVCMYPEVAGDACDWLERQFGQPCVRTVPIGVGATRDFLDEVAAVTGVDVSMARDQDSRLSWYSRSVDANYLTGKRVFIFADPTHARAAARVARDELGFDVVGLGTWMRSGAAMIRAEAERLGAEALITEDYLEVEARIAELHPELVLGTRMEGHVAKRLGIPSAVISAPVHVQDFPARRSPQMGFEGADVIFDAWVQPLMMGLEEHLLTMFRGDFEFRDHTPPEARPAAVAPVEDPSRDSARVPAWEAGAEQELKKIPYFVRGKARRNTERFARERGVATITLETLYDAKAHFGR